MNKSIDDPFVTLSKQILISRYSNPKIIHDFLLNKITRADDLFGFDELQV